MKKPEIKDWALAEERVRFVIIGGVRVTRHL